jgi:hypothetical protein
MVIRYGHKKSFNCTIMMVQLKLISFNPSL